MESADDEPTESRTGVMMRRAPTSSDSIRMSSNLITQSRAAAVFAQVDTDHSGTISFPELKVWWARHKLGGDKVDAALGQVETLWA